MKPNTDKVICPNCVCQFRAITEDVQKLMLDAGFEPPFTTPPAQQEPIEEFAYKALTKRGEHCHFGTHTAARIWAGKGGKVETIKLRHLELVEQPAQQQEPVAWRWKMSLIPDAWQLSDQPHPEAALKEALYTSPPAQRTWVGLTLEDMETTHWSLDFRAGAKWAANKLKEKNT